MNITLNSTLRSLRRKKNVTQEELASHLGITAQSVGKWERGEGFPDITLLPAIALYFGVTTDELLGIDKARIDERIKSLEAESLRLRNLGDMPENLALWESAYREFPNDCRVMSHLMDALGQDPHYPHPKDVCERRIWLGERVLDESTDSKLREHAAMSLCYTFNELRDTKNALKYADMCGSIHSCREGLRAFVTDGEEGVKATQKYLLALIQSAVFAASDMTNKSCSTDDERLTALNFSISLLKLLFSDGRFGFYANDLSVFYEWIAVVHARRADKEKTLTALAESVRYAVEGAEVNGNYTYTSPMVNRVVSDPKTSAKNYKGNACDLRLEDLSKRCYDFLREDERFVKFMSELRAHKELSTPDFPDKSSRAGA